MVLMLTVKVSGASGAIESIDFPSGTSVCFSLLLLSVNVIVRLILCGNYRELYIYRYPLFRFIHCLGEDIHGFGDAVAELKDGRQSPYIRPALFEHGWGRS